ncbi:MAG: DUF134 domain-containing protein [Mailhella sp.]|nr:DUF134 domain-containing protein [Mailhella sp.]
MPRPCKCRRVRGLPGASYFKPIGIPLIHLEECVLSLEGFEALRLADGEGLGMDEAAQRMGVSRHTFGRILRKARHAVAEALVLGRALGVEGGTYSMDGQDAQDASAQNGTF